jgi:outer membrane protein assembly factor BamA
MPIAGPLSADARLGGRVDAPAASARLVAPALSVGTLDDVAVEALADYTPDRIDVRTLTVSWREAIARADGRVSLIGARPVSLRLDAEAFDVGAILAALDRPDIPASGRLAARGAVAGSLESPVAAMEVFVTDLSAYDERLGTLTLEGGLEGQQARISRLALEKPQAEGDAGRLDAHGDYHLDTGAYAFELRTENFRIESLTLPDATSVRGELDVTGEGAGTVADPAGAIRVSARDLHVNARDVGDVLATVSLADRVATFDAGAERFATAVHGRIGIEAPYPGHAELEMNDLRLEALPLEPGTPLAGRLRARVRVDGEAAHVDAGTVAAAIEALDATWNGQPVTLDGPASLGYADRAVTVDALQVRAQDSTIRVSGRVPVDADAPPGALDIDAHLLLATLAAYAPDELGLTADGSVLVTGRVTGTMAAIDPEIAVVVEDGHVMTAELGAPVTAVQMDARVQGGVATVETLSARWAAAEIEAIARLPMALIEDLPIAFPAAEGVAMLEARARDVDPAHFPGAPEGLRGRVSVTAEASAPRVDLAAVNGRVTFDDLELAFRDLALAQERPSAVSLAGGVATIEAFGLSGSAGRVDAAGSVGLRGDRPLDVSASGTLDIAAVAAASDAWRAEGPATFELRAAGTASDPDLGGFVELADGIVVIDEPAVAVENLRARLDLAGSRATLSALSGFVNGGTLSGAGYVTLGEDVVEDVDVTLSVENLAFAAPLDLRSLSDVSFHVSRRDDALLVDGRVAIAEAGLTGDINFDTGILAAIGRPRGLDLTEERDPLLERVQLNVAVATQTPVLVNNNIAKAELSTDVRVLGTPYEVGLAGRMELLSGSTVTLNERRYEVDRGVITFTDDRRITPSFDLRLTTAARHFDVVLGVTGEVGDTEMTLTSEPALPEPDIMALLVTGRTLDDMRGEEYDVAREQALSYLTGRVGSTLGRRLERATGLSEVRVEPNLIANETDPGARLTVGQDLTDSLRLIYSAGLVDSSNQIWVTEYDVTRRFQARVVRQERDSYRFDFRHDLRFGGAPEPRRLPRRRPIVASLDIESDGPTPEATFRNLLGLRLGGTYDFFALRNGVERIEDALRDEGFLQARVRTEHTVADDEATADVKVSVTHGPRVRVEFRGMLPPRRVREDVALRWQRGIFDSQRGGDAVDVLRAWLMDDRYLDPEIAYRVEDPAPGERLVVFDVEPGVQFRRVTLAFEGAHAIDPDVLRAIVEDQDLEEDLFTDPFVVTELLRRYYREEGFLAARLEPPVKEFQGAEARLVIRVSEGPRFVVDRLTTVGNAAVPSGTLLEEAPLRAGETFLPAVVERSLDRIRRLYWQRGYNDVRLRYEVDANPDTGQTAVAFIVREGPRSVVAAVEVEGADRTSEDFVRGELELEPADTLDVSALGRSRRNLYKTGAFSMVEIEPRPLQASATGEASEEDGGQADGTTAAAGIEGDVGKPIALKVAVREVQPYQVSYGLSFDTEGGVGGLVDGVTHNTLGRGRVFGASTRYDSRLRQARVYVSQPMLRDLPLQTTVAAQVRQERNPDTDTALGFNVDRFGGSIQQERQLANAYVWNYGLRYEQARTFDPRPEASFDETLTVTPLTSTFTRETRDEILDATRGSFASQALSYAPEWLGSDRAYLKYYGQFFGYIPLEPERRERLTNEILRPRLVFATGVRIGVARGIGGQVPRSERFFAGGSTTLRGFAQNGVGPIGADGIPAGGAATLILNNELRFPLLRLVDGVGFVDVGGVFPTVAEWSWRDVRKAAGAGLRVRTPWFLIRGDYGFVLDRRPGEPRGRFFVSIGQAF